MTVQFTGKVAFFLSIFFKYLLTHCSSERCGTINILLKYRGWEEGIKNQHNKYCVLSHIVIKSPTHGYTAPCKEGMIFMSHKPIDIESEYSKSHEQISKI